jgi:hypothetical protein
MQDLVPLQLDDGQSHHLSKRDAMREGMMEREMRERVVEQEKRTATDRCPYRSFPRRNAWEVFRVGGWGLGFRGWGLGCRFLGVG